MAKQEKNLDQQKQLNIDAGLKKLLQTRKDTGKTETDLLNVGRPYSFRSDVDPTGSAKQLLEKKMGVVDLMPCRWQYSIIGEDEPSASTAKPKIHFGDAIKTYQDACSSYGLSSDYNGARLFLTDTTTSSDEITNEFDTNFFQASIDSLRTKNRTISKLLNAGKISESASNSVGQTLIKTAGNKAEEVSENNTVGSIAKGVGRGVGRSIVLGQKISFPKIWRDSDYNPNIDINVRLFSPYGHPDAVKKFVIEPLAHLIILCSPRTVDGLMYGHPTSLHVRGYGMINLPLAYPTSISWRRGGDDSSYSIYRQPLIIDVSLRLQSLISGFAYYSEQKPGSESGIDVVTKTQEGSVQGDETVSFPTLGTILESLRPFDYGGSP